MDNAILMQNVTLSDIEQIVSRAVKKEVTAFLTGFKQPEAKPSALVPRREAATRLGVSLTTIDSWAKNGILHSVRKGGRVYFKESELNKG